MGAGSILAELYAADDFLLLANSIREFGGRELSPYLAQLEREQFPGQFISLTGQNGFLGTAIPVEYGGHGGSLEGFLSVLEGVAACDGSLALTLAAHESLATSHIFMGASDEQRQHYLPDLAAGRKLAAWCLTEPQAGSNIFQDMRTKLTRSGDGWKLSGEKTFITNGCHADVLVVLARAIGEDGQDAGMSACVVEKQGNEGHLVATPLHGKMGMWRSDTASVRFDDLGVAESALLGPVGSAERVARRVLLRGRIGVGALALGLACDSLERAVVYAKERRVAGGALFDQPLTRAKFSRMEMDLWVAWQAVRGAAQGVDKGKPFKVQSFMAKVFATETALRIMDEAIQTFGGYGYMRDYKVEQNYRDARMLTIGEGASEILRLAIARNLIAADSGGSGVLPPLESLADDAGPYRGSMSDLWGSSWRALQLAAEGLHQVRDHLVEESKTPDSASTWQCKAVAFADLAIRFWVAIQAVLSGTRLVHQGASSQKQIRLVKTFLVTSSITICHQASEFLRALHLTDATLFSNYIEALQIGAAANSATTEPLTVEHV